MREGLRSRTRSGKVSGGGGVVHNESGDVKNEAFDLGGEGLGAPDLTIEKKDAVEHAVKEECGLDLDVSTSGNVDLAENGKDRSTFSGVANVLEADVDMEEKKEQGSNDGVLIGGRVLRSRSKRGDSKKGFNVENGGVISGNNRGQDRFERVEVKTEYEEVDELVTEGCENERVGVKKERNGKKNLKRKRGRPRKIELKEEDQLVDWLPCKRGRPPLEGKRGRPPLEGKRGRPPLKVGRQNHLLKVAHNRKGKVDRQKGLTMKDGANGNAIEDTNSRRTSGNELEKKGCSPVKKKTENNGVASPFGSNISKALAVDKSGKSKVKSEVKSNVRSKLRQLVRDQIMERLSAAGWTVEYRPRNGRVYNDAVYVSLDGKTHWSITLAYNRLKRHYEAGDGEGKVYGPGFKFTPIPEEDFKILTRVIVKQRKDKWTQKGGKGGKTIDGVNSKEGKGKPGSGAGMGKSVKRKIKWKRSLLDEGNTDLTSASRMPVLLRDHKRHKTHNKKRCALLVRNAEEEIDSEIDGYVSYSGKRTVLAWMIDLGTILQNGKVHYKQDGRECLSGKITGDGIHCGCCNEIVTISDFEAHAGSKLTDPLKNIHIEEGTSLFQCLLDSWNKQDEFARKGFHFVDVAGKDPNDDTCGICGDGGDLICCDGCPSTFHQSCLDIKKFPSGDWHCIYCCCKFCGLVSGSSNQTDGYDDFTMSTLLTCHLCEEKYHKSCIEANGDKTNDCRDVFFCGDRCQELSERLEMLLGVKHEIEDGFSWTFIRRSDVDLDASQIKPHMVEYNSKLAVAVSIMDECFMPYIDHRSGINLIHSIVYNCGSNFKRLNYSGFVTAILERGDEIICAASIRIHGNQLAEMPFIGTRYMYRRQGMCRRLLNAIEWALSSLNVELLVIPAISELRETWTSVFGFQPLELTSKQIINNMNLLVFPHVDMLQKKISKHKFADENLIPTEVSNFKTHTIYKVANNRDQADSTGSELNTSTGTPHSNAWQINKTMCVKSGCRLPESSLNKAPDITSNTVHHCKSPNDVAGQVVCQAVHENLAVENKSTANARDDTCCQAEDMSTYKNTSVVIPKYDEKPIDLDSQSKNRRVPYEESQCLTVSRVSTEATEGHYVGTSLEVTENLTDEMKVANEVVSDNKNDENSAHWGAESIPLDSQIVFSTRESKDSVDSINHGPHKISDCCELRSKTDIVQPDFLGSKEVHADEAEMCSARTPNLKTNINPGNDQSIVVSSGICEKIVDGVNERSKASSVAEANFLPADTDVVPSKNPWMEESSEVDEPDSQVDQTARSNAPSLWSPNTASGAALPCASGGNTSCGNTEVIVLSNQAS
ncbi:uncharacterized protein LOC133303221 [Gastrolobium bilobum]|uniref:uncharacterized protein LOC133303221 n=1 Tax=Gastrolobium bilobum TaxID=150636 RepID=UPI002AAF91E3|nr:uncharacterized protein LOC133303221 [Gastrolobium bilobum]